MEYTCFKPLRITFAALLCCIFSVESPASVPGPADVGRIQRELKDLLPDKKPPAPTEIERNENQLVTPAPKGAAGIRFVLESVTIEGVTAFSKQRLAPVYSQYIGQKIPLTQVWMIADDITRLYRDAGYFLSFAYVPQQNISGGKIRIHVVEGYVDQIDIYDEELQKKRIIQSLKNSLLQKKPVRSQDVESFLLRMNDLPGLSFRSVLSPTQKTGTVRLTLIPGEVQARGYISFDNFNSRYLGPHQFSTGYRKNFLPLQDTSLTISSAPRFDLVYSGAIYQRIPVGADVDLNMNFGYNRANPGFILKPQNIESRSSSYGMSFDYQPLRSRKTNFKINLGIDARETNSDTLGTPLVREKIRAMRLGVNYETFGNSGYTYHSADIHFSRGLDIFDATARGALNLSRGQARPDFIKLNFSYTHARVLNQNWRIAFDLRGQLAPQSLHSPEQFGYGGQNAGRAYDSSEILGDNGISAITEVRYAGMRGGKNWKIEPYAFYDIGKIWNEGVNQPKPTSAASAGGGFKINHLSGITTNLGLAFPMTRTPQNPIYGLSNDSPRVLVQISQEF